MRNLIGLLSVALFVASPSLRIEAAQYRITELDTLGGMDSYATCINSAGEVAGQVGGDAVLWRNGKRVDLGTLGQQVQPGHVHQRRGRGGGICVRRTRGCVSGTRVHLERWCRERRRTAEGAACHGFRY